MSKKDARTMRALRAEGLSGYALEVAHGLAFVHLRTLPSAAWIGVNAAAIRDGSACAWSPEVSAQRLAWARMSHAERISLIVPSYDPRHVEGWMLEHNASLDALSPVEFAAAAKAAAADIENTGPQGGNEFAEAMARSWGL